MEGGLLTGVQIQEALLRGCSERRLPCYIAGREGHVQGEGAPGGGVEGQERARTRYDHLEAAVPDLEAVRACRCVAEQVTTKEAGARGVEAEPPKVNY